jgi:hypothetical protein
MLLRTVHGQSSGQGGFAMVNVTDGSNIDVGLRSNEVFLSHQFLLGLSVDKQRNPYGLQLETLRTEVQFSTGKSIKRHGFGRAGRQTTVVRNTFTCQETR